MNRLKRYKPQPIVGQINLEKWSIIALRSLSVLRSLHFGFLRKETREIVYVITSYLSAITIGLESASSDQPNAAKAERKTTHKLTHPVRTE